MSAVITQYLNSKNVQYETEHKFLPDRRFRFDYAIPVRKVAIEYEGATWARGRHTRGAGYAKDCEKYSLAAINGWCVIRITADMLKNGVGFRLIDEAIK